MHLTQQAVSSTLKTLERDLGVSLIDRRGRHLELTEAGIAFRDGALPILDASEALVRTTRSASTEKSNHFIVAHTPTISSEEIYDLTGSLRDVFPTASITARKFFPEEIVPALRSGIASVALSRGLTHTQGTASATIGYTSLNVALSATHRLAFKKTLKISDLAGHSLTLWGEPGESQYADFLLSLCRRAGFEPEVIMNPIQGTSLTTAVIATRHIAFVTNEPGFYHRQQTLVVPLEDPPMAPTQAQWLRHTDSRFLRHFVGAALKQELQN